MSLMYCYAIIIFMVIVNSNSFENYRIIDPKFVNCKTETDDDYLCYWNPPNGHPNYLNQKFMDPEDFYLTLYKKNYDLIIPNNYSVMIKDEDLKYTGSYSTYWPKRPKFFVVNRQMAKYYMYQSKEKEVVSKGREIMHHLAVEDTILNNTAAVDIKDIIMQEEAVQKNPVVDLVDKKFYKINKTEYNVLLNLMAFLPKVNEHVAHYLKRYFVSVYSLLYINVNFIRYIDSQELLTIMSKDRVKNLKSPYLMLRESYNCYVIRMKNMNVIPFHIDFFKKKYNLFKDDNGTKTIFDEFEVHFKEVQHQEFQEERVEQFSEDEQGSQHFQEESVDSSEVHGGHHFQEESVGSSEVHGSQHFQESVNPSEVHGSQHFQESVNPSEVHGGHHFQEESVDSSEVHGGHHFQEESVDSSEGQEIQYSPEESGGLLSSLLCCFGIE